MGSEMCIRDRFYNSVERCSTVIGRKNEEKPRSYTADANSQIVRLEKKRQNMKIEIKQLEICGNIEGWNKESLTTKVRSSKIWISLVEIYCFKLLTR